MYPGHHAKTIPDKPAYVMASSGEVVTYGQLDERSNRCARLFREVGLGRGASVAILLENHPRFFEPCWAAQRSGLYYTPIAKHLLADEIEYIANDCGAAVLITSYALRDSAAELADRMPAVRERFMIDGSSSSESRPSARSVKTK